MEQCRERQTIVLLFEGYKVNKNKIKCPVFVIGGRQDKVVGGAASEEIADKLGCPIYMYEELGHAAYEEAKDFNKRVYDFLKEIGEVIHTVDGPLSITQVLDKFLFFKESQYSYISNLSGGEKRRLYLLSVLLRSPNVLILDEPTNDLDIDTLEVLEEYLDEFKGAVIIVSHDRYFLDKTVDNILYLKENGIIEKYNGNYTDFANKQKEEEKQIKEKEEKKIIKQNNSKPIKMTYNERKEFETIMDVISQIEDEINELDTKINNSYMNYALVKDEMIKKEQLEKKLEEKLERWEYLSNLDEQSKR